MILLSLDPGLVATGWARFSPRLTSCGLVAGGSGSVENRAQRITAALPFAGITDLVVELPQVYLARRSKGDPNDLINLAFLVGALGLASRLLDNHIRLVKPREWKGTIPKRKIDDYLIHRRNLAALRPGERRVYERGLATVAAGLRHNISDAVGLGRWWINESS